MRLLFLPPLFIAIFLWATTASAGILTGMNDMLFPLTYSKEMIADDIEDIHIEDDARISNMKSGWLEKKEFFIKGENNDISQVRYSIVDGKIRESVSKVPSDYIMKLSLFLRELVVYLARNCVTIMTGENVDIRSKNIASAQNKTQFIVPGITEAARTGAAKSIATKSYSGSITKHENGRRTEPALKVVKKTERNKRSGMTSKRLAKKRSTKKHLIKLLWYASNSSPLTKPLTVTITLASLAFNKQFYQVSMHSEEKELLAEAEAMGMKQEWFTSAATLPTMLHTYGVSDSDWQYLMLFYHIIHGDAADSEAIATMEHFRSWFKTHLQKEMPAMLSFSDAYINLCLQYTALIFNIEDPPPLLFHNMEHYINFFNPFVRLQQLIFLSPEMSLDELCEDQKAYCKKIIDNFDEVIVRAGLDEFYIQLQLAVENSKKITVRSFYNKGKYY